MQIQATLATEMGCLENSWSEDTPTPHYSSFLLSWVQGAMVALLIAFFSKRNQTYEMLCFQVQSLLTLF